MTHAEKSRSPLEGITLSDGSCLDLLLRAAAIECAYRQEVDRGARVKSELRAALDGLATCRTRDAFPIGGLPADDVTARRAWAAGSDPCRCGRCGTLLTTDGTCPRRLCDRDRQDAALAEPLTLRASPPAMVGTT